VYGLIGLGLSLIFTGIRNNMNIMHGQMALLGSHFAFTASTFLGIDPLLSLIIVLPVAFCVGFILQYTLLNRVVLEPPTYILTTVGISLVIENSILIIYGPDLKSLTPYTADFVKTFTSFASDLRIPNVYIIDFVTAVIAMMLIFVFLKYTYMGRAIRATSQDHVAANLLGVNDRKIYATTFGIGSSLAALGGFFAGLTYAFEPFYGPLYLSLALAVMILGGLGSIRGAVVGGIIIGLIQAVVSYLLGITWAQLASNAVTLIFLAFKPEGIFGYRV